MFSSIFSASPPVDPEAPTLLPVSSRFKESELFGELVQKDTEWLCAGGFSTETQVFYTITNDGLFVMCQVIHSSLGLWYPTIQFTFKFHNPKTNETIWKSVNVSNFVSPPPGLDKRSCKADEFSVTYKSNPDSEYPESYIIRAQISTEIIISLEFARPATVPGFKVGAGDEGGFTYFGNDPKKPEGYVIHRFWPRFKASGQIIRRDSGGQPDIIDGYGMFAHAIQGMRPNLIASRWNFAYFGSNDLGGVSAIQMEFTSQPSHGRKGAGSGGAAVTVGSLVVGNKLVAITAETRWPDEKPSETASLISRVEHLDTEKDSDTGYHVPSKIHYQWAAPSLDPSAPGKVSADLQLDLGNMKKPNGLIDKVDVLAEIPYVVKVALNYVAGTKPYIYQYLIPADISITGPDHVHPELSQGKKAHGVVYAEQSYIS